MSFGCLLLGPSMFFRRRQVKVGEVKQRRQEDSLFGKVRKGGRGILLTNPITIRDGAIVSLGFAIDPIELRRAVLFWDTIAYPTNSIVSFDPTPEEEFLVKEGIMIRPPAKFIHPLSRSTAHLGAAFVNVFLDLEKENPGMWSLAQGEHSLQDFSTSFRAGRGALVEIYRAIPLPSRDVPLEDLLHFKARRRDELGSLVAEIEQTFLDAVRNDDSELALRGAVRKVEQRCADLVRVGRESRIPFQVSDLKINFSCEFSTGNLISPA